MLPLSQSMWPLTACSLLLLLFSSTTSFFPASQAGSVGVNYGRVANNLPPAANVVQLLKSQGIDQVKLYDTDSTVLRALAGTGIRVVVALPNEQLAATASRPGFALTWVQRNVAAYHPATQIQAIAVGNEDFVDPRNQTAALVLDMQNVHATLVRLRLDADVKVSSPIALTTLQNSYPSSAGELIVVLSEPRSAPLEAGFSPDRTGEPPPETWISIPDRHLRHHWEEIRERSRRRSWRIRRIGIRVWREMEIGRSWGRNGSAGGRVAV